MPPQTIRRPRPTARNRRARHPRIRASYFKLVKEFPLTHIRDGGHLDEASEMIDRLLERELDEAEQEYFDVLTDLVEAYEDDHVDIPDASEADVLRELMRANGLSQSELAQASKIAQSTISAVLHGSRRLTRDHIDRLSKLFGVEKAAFL